jgi:hypothetical protein
MAFNEGIPQIELDERTNDWLQANWEILVENTVLPSGEYLEVYGVGADVNDDSSRVCFPDKLPTHRIYCMSPNDAPVIDLLSQQLKHITRTMTFFGFVSWDQGYFRVSSPFDHVLLENGGDRIVVRISDVFFDVEAIKQPARAH